MKVSEVCNANMTCLSIDIVHSLVKSQTSFQAGELKHFLSQWEAIMTDPTILQTVTGVELEFKNNVAPMQHYGRPSVFTILDAPDTWLLIRTCASAVLSHVISRLLMSCDRISIKLQLTGKSRLIFQISGKTKS